MAASTSALPTAGKHIAVPPGITERAARGEWVDALILLDDSEERAAEESALPSTSNAKSESKPEYALRMQTRGAKLNALKQRVAAEAAERVAAEAADRDIVTGRFYSVLPVMHVRVKSSAALNRLARHLKVLSIDENLASQPFLAESLPLIRQPQAASSGFRGAGTTIAVLDTGVDYSLPAFGSCIAPGGSCKVNFAQDFAPSDVAKDANGHGTNVAAIALGVAPDAKIAALDVFSPDGLAYSSDLISAINWCVTNKVAYNIAAINMSLGGGRYYAPIAPTDSFGVTVQAAVNAGITVVAAAGNNGYKDSLSWPAAYSNVVSVGAVYDSAFGSQSYGICSDATTAADKVTCFSNSASFLTVLAPGANIAAAGVTMVGTSQATPHVAGAVAVLRAANPTATVEQIKLQIAQSPSVTDTNGISKPRIDLTSSQLVRTQFVEMTPCRVVDTRSPAAYPVSGGTIASGETRTFALGASSCGIPTFALAYSLNATVVPHGSLGYVTLWPAGRTMPTVSTVNSADGRVKANAAIVQGGTNGAISAYVTDSTDLILDISGYFVAVGTGVEQAFYPITPCRLADTRNAAGINGGPSISAGETRTISTWNFCNIPAGATSLSLNYTVVPQGPLGYLTTWPAGDPMPLVSTLNAPTGTVVSNAAIVPAGSLGQINIFASQSTDVIVDVNGYFANPGSPGALSFYTSTPCRIADTRLPIGPFGGPQLTGGNARSFAASTSSCAIPSSAAAYSLNVTVVPTGLLGYLTLWPTGLSQPLASTLNAWDGAITSNAALVKANAVGAFSVYAPNSTDVILDINGYFAP